MSFKWLLLLLIFIIPGCQRNIETKEDADFILLEQIVDSPGTYELYGTSDTYQFTDKIPVLLKVNADTSFVQYDILPDTGDIWGDFFVQKKMVRPDDTVLWYLIPEKIGSAELSSLDLSVKIGTVEKHVQFKSRELTIQSSLMNDSGVPEGLLEEQSENSGHSWFLMIFLLLLIAGGIALSLVLLRKKKRKHIRQRTNPESPDEILNRLILLDKNPEFMKQDRKEQYRVLYQMVYLFLSGLSSQFRKGLSPELFIKELERPSSFNQWALRTLYPILSDMEELFYNPGFDTPDDQKLIHDIRTIEECFRFLQKEEKMEHV